MFTKEGLTCVPLLMFSRQPGPLCLAFGNLLSLTPPSPSPLRLDPEAEDRKVAEPT